MYRTEDSGENAYDRLTVDGSGTAAYLALEHVGPDEVGKREHLIGIYLDARMGLIDVYTISIGTMTECPVHPREIFRKAIELGADSLILLHNHPSGDPTPSQPDIDVTIRIGQAGQLLGITLHDHIVFSASGAWRSIVEKLKTMVSEANAEPKKTGIMRA